MTQLTHLPIWKKLETHHQEIKKQRIQDFFQADSQRFQKFSLQFEDILLDFSKNPVTDITLKLFEKLAQDSHLSQKIQDFFSGACINFTEQRAVLHPALRSSEKNDSVIASNVTATKKRMEIFVNQVREQRWMGVTGKPIRDVIHIGIGGSDLGPKMVSHALANEAISSLRCYFVSDVDYAYLETLFQKIDPERSLVIISSKTFTTPETLLNARTIHHWLSEKLGAKNLAPHFVAVTANLNRASEFSIPEQQIFPFWDWVGGRYSVWSAIGLPIALQIGMDQFNQFLAGAESIDKHFKQTPFLQNIPVMMALLGIWQINFFGAHAHAILPYSYALKYFRDYIQQLDMESNGKSVNREGNIVDYATGPFIIGEQGCDSQHSFFQLLHQGLEKFSADFILVAKNHNKIHQNMLIASALSQAKAFMMGKSSNEIQHELAQKNFSVEQIKALTPHKILFGNRSSNVIFLPAITPYTLGQLIALYEHKIFVQGAIWNINSFDQWGVELGKQLLPAVMDSLNNQQSDVNHDSSTLGLIDYYRRYQ